MIQRPLVPAVAAGVAIIAFSAAAIGISIPLRILTTSDIGWLLGQAVFASVGTVVLYRQPRNVVGLLLACSGIIGLLQSVLWRYAALALASPAALPGAVPAAWLAGWVYVPMFALFIVLLPLHYPNGALPSRRWRPVVYATLGLTVWVSIYLATAPGPLEDFPVDNPYALGVSARISAMLDPVGGDDLMLSVFFLLAALALTSLVLRYRKAEGVERLQLKWFVWSIALLVGYLLVSGLVLEVLLNRAASTVSDVIGLLFLLCVPISVGVAVLRYRLYDIDRIISRTVSYGVLTLLLVGTYFAAVTALTAVTAPVTGDSPIAVAAATLLAAAVFQPSRRRIQSGVDRRFNRARYDARRTVEAFSAALRSEVDLDDVRTHLVDTVGRVLEPRQVRVWLRPGFPS